MGTEDMSVRRDACWMDMVMVAIDSRICGHQIWADEYECEPAGRRLRSGCFARAKAIPMARQASC